MRTAPDVGYNGALGAGVGTDFGFVGSGSGGEVPAFTGMVPDRPGETAPVHVY
ncbi:hypothetical protein GCM10023196_043680 [Actinoallomurus vinaceus]|uniref:Uncharacterized protein n=1 Tax=Actinoallomurus vinaceus TaxID=1080074 RepID=A0ABP8UEG9_9ACTN